MITFSLLSECFSTLRTSPLTAHSQSVPASNHPRQNLIDDTKRGSGPTPKLRKSVKGESPTSFHRFLKVHDFSPLSGKYYWNFSHSTNSIWPTRMLHYNYHVWTAWNTPFTTLKWDARGDRIYMHLWLYFSIYGILVSLFTSWYKPVTRTGNWQMPSLWLGRHPHPGHIPV